MNFAVTTDQSNETIRLVNKNLSSETELKYTRSNKKLDKCGKSYMNNFCFNSWLVGYTDGDGCFNIYTNIKKKKNYIYFQNRTKRK